MELLLLAVSWWLIGFTGAMVPGPVTTLIVTETARRGFVAGPLITLGHVLLEGVVVIALFFGLGDLVKQNSVAGAIGLLGGLFLLWMGGDIVRGVFRGKMSTGTAPNSARPKPAANPILAGVITSAANPYWILWWATVGAAYLVSFRAFALGGILAFYFGHTLADWVWNNVIAFVVATGRRAMNEQVYSAILLACAIFLIALGLGFIVSGFGFLQAA